MRPSQGYCPRDGANPEYAVNLQVAQHLWIVPELES